jgi:hypothetical protein
MRRIEITVERHSISRVFRGGQAGFPQAGEGVPPEPDAELLKPPDC